MAKRVRSELAICGRGYICVYTEFTLNDNL